MATHKSVLRKTPAATLRTFFQNRDFDVVDEIDWSAPEPVVTKAIMAVLDNMGIEDQGRVIVELDRVAAMADEAGTTAMQYVLVDPGVLETRANGQDRALWLYLNDITAFRHAEEIRFTEERRRRSTWTGYVCEPGLVVPNDQQTLAQFEASLRELFSAKNVHVDVFDRRRAGFDGAIYTLVQITVYREGLPDDLLGFDANGALQRRAHRPVVEAALTYEPSTGVIEVVAGDQGTRNALARSLAAELLGADVGEVRLPLRRYDLDHLRSPFGFPTDLDDGIESVEVRKLRLMPIDKPARRVTLECMAREDATIWTMAEEEFGSRTPLRSGWVITQANLVIRFTPRDGSRRSRALPLNITMPHGCDLKELTEQEQLIGQKYLRRWGILVDDEPLVED